MSVISAVCVRVRVSMIIADPQGACPPTLCFSSLCRCIVTTNITHGVGTILRAVLLTLTDVVRDWRGGKLMRPKSEGGGGDAATAPSPGAPPAAGPAAGAGGGVAAAAAAALSGQELDPAGAARALRLLFERVRGRWDPGWGVVEQIAALG